MTGEPSDTEEDRRRAKRGMLTWIAVYGRHLSTGAMAGLMTSHAVKAMVYFTDVTKEQFAQEVRSMWDDWEKSKADGKPY